MAPRLPAVRAMNTPSPFLRLFSSTSLNSALRYPASPEQSQPPQRSSSSNLLSMRSDRHGPSPTGAYSRSDAVNRLTNRFKERHETIAKTRQASIDYLREQKNSNDYLKQMPRNFQPGDVYSPHDLSPKEMQKWRRRTPRQVDVIDAMGLSPVDLYKNFSLIQEFTNSSAMISSSRITQLRPVNQRKIAKMIRRIQGMGLYPRIHDHPEMVRNSFFPLQRR